MFNEDQLITEYQLIVDGLKKKLNSISTPDQICSGMITKIIELEFVEFKFLVNSVVDFLVKAKTEKPEFIYILWVDRSLKFFNENLNDEQLCYVIYEYDKFNLVSDDNHNYQVIWKKIEPIMTVYNEFKRVLG